MIRPEDLLVLDLQLLQPDALLLPLTLLAGRLRGHLLRRLHVVLSESLVILCTLIGGAVLLNRSVHLHGAAGGALCRD